MGEPSKMKRAREVLSLEGRLMSELIEVARSNWRRWCDVFEHRGPVATNPLLADARRFRSFHAEYYVGRTIWNGRHVKFRRKLRNSSRFLKSVGDDGGHALDRLEQNLRPHFGSRKGKNQITSVLSKVAAFVRPDRFVAWDRFAKKGLNIVLGRSGSSPFETYAEYPAAFEIAWKGQPGKQIRATWQGDGAQNTVEREPRFLPRVLDVYLMKCGGRSF